MKKSDERLMRGYHMATILTPVERTMPRRLRAALPITAAVSVFLLFGTTGVQAQHPDFTGVWASYNDPGQTPGGGRGAGPALPMNDMAKQKVARYRALVEPTGDTPGGYCLGTGMPGSMLGSGGYPMEIHQRPEQIIIVYEAHNEIRRVYLGDRIVPEADRLPGRNGHSTGRWDGNTLVVETGHLVEQVDQRYAHSAKAKIVERYHLEKGAKGETVLVAEMTMTDPEFYTAPVVMVKKWQRVPNGHLLPYECAEEGWIKHLEDLERNAAAKEPGRK
jgi:hypothetical protein